MGEYFNHNLLSKIDSDKKAYILGWLSTGKFVADSKAIIIKTGKENYNCLNLIKTAISNKFIIKIFDTNISLLIKSKRLFACVNRKHDISDDLLIYFYRGLIEGAGNFNITSPTPQYEIKTSDECIEQILSLGVLGNKIDTKLVFASTNCIDLFGKIYNDRSNASLLLSSTYIQFLQYTDWRSSNLNICKVYKKDDNAIIPSKTHYSDVGYDITIIKKIKDINSTTSLYDTGLSFNVSFGYYIELVPRSSLSKSGYMLSNSIGIIEKSYTGTILVPLTKVAPEAEDIVLPFKCCQLLFKPQVYMNILDASLETEDITNRGNGGFGSTDVVILKSLPTSPKEQ